jgi:hypothetical protein
MAKTHPDQPETPADIGKIRRAVNGAPLPTVTVQPSYLDIVNATDPGTPGYTGPRAPQPGSSYAARFATGALGPMTAGQAAALRAPEIAARQNAALDEAAAAPVRSGAAPAVLDGAVTPPPTYPYGPGHGLKRLASGVSRYALGGDIAGPNATPIYTTRGKNGEAVFTDDAGFAARNSTGGLRRGEVNADVYANAQENAKTNPNAGYEFAPSTLNTRGIKKQVGTDANGNPIMADTGGLRRADFQTFDPQMTEAALAAAQGGVDNTEQGLSNRMDANLLRARRISQQQQAAEGAQSLDPRTQIALLRAQTTAAQGAERNAIARDALEETRRGRTTAQQNADRQQQSDFFKQYQAIRATDPAQAASYLADQIPKDPDTFDKWANTATGQQVLSKYLTDVLQPGARDSLYWPELGDKRAVPKLGYQDLNIDPKSGAFRGFDNPDGSGNQYPRSGSFLWGIGGSHYDKSVEQLPAPILRRLKDYGKRTHPQK